MAVTTAEGRLTMDVTLVLWCAGMLLAPFYLFESGGMQIADLVTVVALGSLFLTGGFQVLVPIEGRGIVSFLVGLYVWICIVSSFWAMTTADLSVLRPVAWYGFNMATGFGVMALLPRYGPRVIELITRLPIVVLAYVLITTLLGFGGDSVRLTSGFNNPNQLGYYTVLATSIFFAGAYPERRSVLASTVVLAMAGALTTMSASRAAMGALLPLVALVALRSLRSVGASLAMVLILGASAWLMVSYGGELIELVQNRFSMTGATLDRGYGRLLAHPGYLVFGAGEGALYRFDSSWRLEIHSTLGTVLFSYGIVGLMLLVGMLVQPVLLGGWQRLVPLIPAMLYGLSHQGLRFTELWVLVSVLTLGAIVERRDRLAASSGASGTAPLGVPPRAREA